MQGWTPDFIPKLTEDAVTMELIDRILPISGADAIRCAKDLAVKEGIFVGISSGGPSLAPSRSQLRRRRARPFSACYPTPVSAISARRSLPTSLPI